ncbi:MAG: PEP-CTERM sorting domain-containing protein [Planctomycetota bacterium]|nr:PEP-CTERM sorting domain-containing protein [Planctomycetota bacterium]
MQSTRGCIACATAMIGLAGFTAPSSAGTLYGIGTGPDMLYLIDPVSGVFTDVGPVALSDPDTEFAIGGLEFGPDGTLYGFTLKSQSRLYAIEPKDAFALDIGPIGLTTFEGSLVFDFENEIMYGVNGVIDGLTSLMTIDLDTGQATAIGIIGDSPHDFNGLAMGEDGLLYGIDRVTNALWRIDTVPNGPGTMLVGELGPNVTLGAFGGMAVDLDSGTVYGYDGPSHMLFTIDLATGNTTVIHQHESGPSITGLAYIPEPSTSALLALAAASATLRRRRVVVPVDLR